MIVDDFPYKTCSGCHQVLSIDSFRPRRRGGTESRCRPCLAAYMRQWREKRRTKRLRQFQRDMGRAESLRQMESLVTVMAGRFGGVDGLAREWANALRAAKDAPNPAPALRGFEVLARGMEKVDRWQRQQHDAATLADEELEREYLRSAEAMIVSCPELAVVAAERLGWTVIPPA